jgi:LmbE family N-acetylglucosaminyl deacetylase
MTILYVSPHFDDAALSCAGGLLARSRRGERVVVCSVFTRGAAFAVRAAEDAAALSYAQAEGIDLGLTDAPEREGFPASFRVLTEAPLRPELVAEVARLLGQLVTTLDPHEVWLPFGIGGHIDHRTVFAARHAVGKRARFYEDRPYAFVPTLRLLRHGMVAHVPPRVIARQLTAGGCAALGADPAALSRALVAPAAPRPVVVRPVPGAPLADARAMIACYQSQLAWLGALPSLPERELLLRNQESPCGGPTRLRTPLHAI